MITRPIFFFFLDQYPILMNFPGFLVKYWAEFIKFYSFLKKKSINKYLLNYLFKVYGSFKFPMHVLYERFF